MRLLSSLLFLLLSGCTAFKMGSSGHEQEIREVDLHASDCDEVVLKIEKRYSDHDQMQDAGVSAQPGGR